jgi:hypothetical protein
MEKTVRSAYGPFACGLVPSRIGAVYVLEVNEVGREDEFTVKIGRMRNADFRVRSADVNLYLRLQQRQTFYPQRTQRRRQRTSFGEGPA